jgi:hypothetical protein
LQHSVLLAWEHGGNLGHLARLIPIALALRRRGASVRFAVADLAAASACLQPLDFDVFQAPALSPMAASGPVLNHADLLLRSGFGAPIANLHSAIDAWQLLFAEAGADAVLVDASPIALYATAAAGLPAFALGHGFEIPPLHVPRPCFAPWVEGAQESATQAEARLQQRLEELARTTGGPASMEQLYRHDWSLLCAWPELDHFDRGLDEDRPVALGPIWHEMSASQADFAGRAGPKVLCYLNLTDKRHDLLWQALGRAGANILVLSPGGSARAADAARGWGIQVIEHPCAIAPLLQDCDAVVSHGGMGLTSMALRAGKPLLLLPDNVEQAILAQRLVRQGLARATIRVRDRRKMQLLADGLLEGGEPGRALRDFSARYASYTPRTAVNAAVERLLGPARK